MVAVSKPFMSEILNKNTVLVRHRNWQAINIRTPVDALRQMTANVATTLDIESESHIRPVPWDEWITLPVHSKRLPASGAESLQLQIVSLEPKPRGD